MDDYDLALSRPDLRSCLESQGYTWGEVCVRMPDETFLIEINRHFVFPRDVLDLANGRASLPAVMARNVGKVFAQSSHP